MNADGASLELIELATNWFEEIRGDEHSRAEDSFGSQVTEMSFFTSAETQWEFLKVAVNMAENEKEFGYVAAFSFEQFMSEHGRDYIDDVERHALENEKFRSVVKRSWRHSIDRRTWRRIEIIQGVTRPFWKLW